MVYSARVDGHGPFQHIVMDCYLRLCFPFEEGCLGHPQHQKSSEQCVTPKVRGQPWKATLPPSCKENRLCFFSGGVLMDISTIWGYRSCGQRLLLGVCDATS
jgi:hypothetical protein